jgi:hypothetical protein
MTDFQPSSSAAGSFQHDNLIGGDVVPAVTESITVLSGNLSRGALLGKITASGKYVLSLSAAADGSQVPTAILAEDTDATGGEKRTVAYLSGEFNTAAVTFGTGHTAGSVSGALRGLSIYLKTNLPA